MRGHSALDDGAHDPGQKIMSVNQMSIQRESDADRLHREYAWSRRDGDITRNGVVFRWWLAGPGGAAFKLFREPHHSDADIQQAENELRTSRDVVELGVAEIHTVEEYGVEPLPGCEIQSSAAETVMDDGITSDSPSR